MKKQPSKLKQWLWFVGLWCFGVGVLLVITLPIKLLLKAASSG